MNRRIERLKELVGLRHQLEVFESGLMATAETRLGPPREVVDTSADTTKDLREKNCGDPERELAGIGLVCETDFPEKADRGPMSRRSKGPSLRLNIAAVACGLLALPNCGR
jgi:hypothetical protein